MRSVNVLLILVLVLLAQGAGAACDPKAVLEAHLRAGAAPANSTVILARDHLGGWFGGRWNGTNIVQDDGFANLHLIEPSVTLERNDEFRVYVVNTNPLAYTAVQTGGVLQDREDLADLQKIISLLANVGTSAFQVAGSRQAAEGLRTTNATKFANAQQRILQNIDTPIDRLNEIAGAVIVEVANTASQVDGQVTAIRTAASGAERLVTRADQLNTDAILFVTRVEMGDGVPQTITVDPNDNNLPSMVEGSFTRLGTAVAALEAAPISCPAAVAAAAAAVDRKIVGLGDDAGDQLVARRDYRTQLSEMAAETARCTPAMSGVLDPLRRWLIDNPPTATGATEPQLTTLIDLHIALQHYAAIATARADALTKATEVVTKRGTAVRTASAFLELRQRFQRSFAGGDPCTLTNGFIEVRRFLRTDLDQPFTKDGKETFKVSVDSRFAEEALRHPEELESSYNVVARRSFDIDLDFAAVYTNLSDPTFGVVTHVLEEATADAPAKTEKRIERTNETTRAGEVALMASFHGTIFGRNFNPIALQVGAGLSTDKPALYTGIAYQLGRYVKLSGGVTFQKVTRLAEGLSERDVVTDDSELRTRDAFKNGWYAALSITLDNLDFFRPSS